MVGRSVKFHLVLALVAVALLSALHHEPAEVAVAAHPDLTSHMGRSATELGQTALRQRSGYTMGGWALGDWLPLFADPDGCPELTGVEIACGYDLVFEISGAPLMLDGKVILPATPTKKQCHDVLGAPNSCASRECDACREFLEWSLQDDSKVQYRLEDGTLTLTSFPTYHGIRRPFLGTR